MAVFLVFTVKPQSMQYNRRVQVLLLSFLGLVQVTLDGQPRVGVSLALSVFRVGVLSLDILFSSTERWWMKYLNKSGDIGCPCSVPHKI